MTRHNDAVVVRHIHEHATEALHLASGKTRADLDSENLWKLWLIS
jgi:hypothetical protein